MSEAATTTGQETTGAGAAQATEGVNAGQATAVTQTPGAQGTEANGQGQTAEVNYEFKMPEGVELDKQLADEFVPIAKELGLKPEQAQRIAELQAKAVQRQQQAWTEQVQQWQQDVTADKEIGGDKLPQTLAYAKAAIDLVGDPALVQLLDSTGYGNHPVIVKAFAAIGKKVAPDSFVGGKPAAPAGDDALLAKLYPTMKGA